MDTTNIYLGECYSGHSFSSRAVSGETTGYLAGVIIANYDGTLVRHVDLSGIGFTNVSHLTNDIALNRDTGDLYATDSIGSQIWKLNASANYDATTFVHDN